MNESVLIVDDAPDSRRAAERALAERFDVRTAGSAAAALGCCEREGPFAVVVSDQDMPGPSGTQLFARLRRLWPDTARILLTGHAELDVAVLALHEGAIFRFLRKPVRVEELRAAVAAGSERFRRVEQERLLVEQLQFSRESLLGMTEALERRLVDQATRMSCLLRLSDEFHETESPAALATLAARAGSRLLGGRAVAVRLDGGEAGPPVEEHAGGPPAFPLHVEPVGRRGTELGRLQISEVGADGRLLSSVERELVRSLASTLAIAVQGQLSRRARDRARHATVFALARLAESRDDATGRHLERVSEYCRMIAEGLREDGRYVGVLTDRYVHDLVLSAPLHDIGKVGVPDSILLKPGKLSPEEWEVMRRHPQIGAETLSHVMEGAGEDSFLCMGREIALAHHERWDGSGYPRGLAGDEIPLAARIVALADCYDALTTWRPYKHAWSHEEALGQIRADRGRHFDPGVVDAFLRRADRAEAIRARLAAVAPA